LLAMFTTTLLLPAAAQEASFEGLGQMPGASKGFGTYANALSADGSTIVGYAWVCMNGQAACESTGKTYSFRWTPAGKYEVLGHLGGNQVGNMANAVNSDGSVIVGAAPNPNSAIGGGAFRWTPAQGMVALPAAMPFGDGVTPDGNMVVGGDNWWKITGEIGKFGPHKDIIQAFAAMGTMTAPIVAGAAFNGFDVFRWTPATGIQNLGNLGGAAAAASAISEDGSVIVGLAMVEDGTFNLWHAFRWTVETGMQDLGTLGGAQSAAYGVNHDGSVIVGYSDTTGSSGSGDAFIWTPQTGMQSLVAVLQAHGVHTADDWVTVAVAAGISADGTIITGSGQGPRTKEFPFGVDTPFRIVLPVP
jgi:probable HAF family extracellular repeat protein